MGIYIAYAHRWHCALLSTQYTISAYESLNILPNLAYNDENKYITREHVDQHIMMK